MSTTSTVTLPILVEDQKAISELKKVQSALGAVGLESQKLNKTIASGMESMAKKAGAAFEDIASKTKGATTRFIELNQALEVGKKIISFGKEAVELAKFSAEFRRMEAAVPVGKMRELESVTRGTASRFEMLKQATKGMDLPVTDAVLKIERTQAAWSNLVDSVKLGLGDLVNEIGHAAGRLLGIVEATRAERLIAGSRGTALATGKFTGSDLNEYRSPFNFLPGVAMISQLSGNITGDAGVAQQSMDFQARRAQALAAVARQLQVEDASSGTIGAAIFAQKFGQGVGGVSKGKTQRQKGREAQLQSGSWYTDMLRNPDPIGDTVTGGIRGGMDALQEWSIDPYGPKFGSGLGDVAKGLAAAPGALLGAGVDGISGKLKAQNEAMAEFSKKLGDQTTAIGGAFTAMSAGLTAAVDAAITGSDSIGRAFLKAAGAALRGIALESTARAAYETAMGIGALANPLTAATAAGHFASAKAFAVAAAIAGVGSAGLSAAAGSGGGSGGGASRGGGNARDYAPVTGAQSDGGSQHITINMTVPPTHSAGEMGEALTKAVDFAQRQGKVRSERNVVVRYE
jgi:hypothetical protein